MILAALDNIHIICPFHIIFSIVLINNCRLLVRMFIIDRGELPLIEDTTRSYNLAMSFYTVGASITLDMLKVRSPAVRYVSLADDIKGAGKLNDLKTLWNNLIYEEKKTGYYVNESKSGLKFEKRELWDHAGTINQDAGIKLTCKENLKTKFVSWKELIGLSRFLRRGSTPKHIHMQHT